MMKLLVAYLAVLALGEEKKVKGPMVTSLVRQPGARGPHAHGRSVRWERTNPSHLRQRSARPHSRAP